MKKGDRLSIFIYACYYIALVPFVLKKLKAYLEEPEKNAQMS